MASLVELVNIHRHRIYVSTDFIRRLEPRGEEPPTTLVAFSAGEHESVFEVAGFIDDVADWINEHM